MRPWLSLIAVILTHASTGTATAHAQTTGAPVANGRAAVNGAELYYELHGDGPPLILLHGGVTPSEMFGAPLAEMAKSHRVVAVHTRGHGLSTDGDAPWSYETFADDVAALMRHLGIPKAAVMGYSSGASVALQTAIRHPALVERLVVVSAAARSEGLYPEVLKAFAEMPASAAALGASVSQSPLAALYPAVDWRLVFEKTGVLANRRIDWSAAVAGITAPTLLIFADADMVRPEHIAEFYRLLGGGSGAADLGGAPRSVHQLAIIPNTTHVTLLGSALVTQFATAFLRTP